MDKFVTRKARTIDSTAKANLSTSSSVLKKRTHSEMTSDNNASSDTDETEPSTTIQESKEYSKLENYITDATWKEQLQSEFSKTYFTNLKRFLQQQKDQKKAIYPKIDNIFFALNSCPFEKVRVVLIGQDPYHQFENQAMGLCFSVNKGVEVPPSLKNIYKELKQEYPSFSVPKHGDLTGWSNQGVLLLNAILTVEANKPMSHAKQGWEQFTHKIIQIINEKREHVVFIVWGKKAAEKVQGINKQKHLILEAAHPSPLSAHSGFFGCNHFVKCNEFLSKNGLDTIDWAQLL